MSDTPVPSSEETARFNQAEDSAQLTDHPDPTGANDEQLAAKQAANVLGDQDAINLAGSRQYPAGAELPSPQNVRRYPELFTSEVIDQYSNVEDTSTPADIITDVDVAREKGQEYATEDGTTESTSYEDTTDVNGGSTHVTF